MNVGNLLLGVGGVVYLAFVQIAAQTPQTNLVPLAGNPQVQGSVEQVMKRMKMRSPEEFERLNKLRQEDPEAFRKALKERLEKVRKGNAPGDKKYADVTTGNERGPAGQHTRNPGGAVPQDDLARRYPELGKHEQDIRALAERYKAAAPDEQVKLRAELRKKIGETFELREKLRQETIQRAEAQLAKLKKDSGKAKREAVIESRFKELTEVPVQATR
jgi:molybdopterin converting factor small subunit